ncbi:MAG: cell division protein SepF [Clostridia bacterium]|nr:cell division protein SepF [Clostridia bacterium]
MANGDFIGNLKDKMRSVYNGFLYNGEEDLPRNQKGNKYAQGAGYKPQPPAQQPVQQTNEQRGNNIVDFGAYQQQMQHPAPQQFQQGYQPQPQMNQPQPQHPMQPQQPGPQSAFQSYQRPQQPPVQQPPMQPQPQQPPMQQPTMQPQPQQMPPQQGMPQMSGPAPLSARIINARGIGDCRSAITLLRNGDAVLIVMENINDQAEQRRLVDTLSGACYSLTATITKVSRAGVYLLAPQTVAVYADQITNQMNSMPGRPAPNPGYQPGYHGQRAPYQHQQPQQPQVSYAPPQQGFTRRAAAPEEAPQPFYNQPAPQAAQAPAFTAQPVGNGYAPDEARAQ